MKKRDAIFYLKAVEIYNTNTASLEEQKKLFENIFKDLSTTEADDLCIEHLTLMDLAQNFFSSEEVEDYEKAGMLKKRKEATVSIFDAREKHLNALKKSGNISQE